MSDTEDVLPLFYGLSGLSASEETDASCIESICVDGDQIAASNRPNNDSVWAYGEIMVGPFVSLLRTEMLEHPEAAFIDIGSGTGKAVFAASKLLGFSRAVGVETLHALHEASKANHERFRKIWPSEADRVSFVHSDFRDIEWWKDAAVVFCNCATWPETLVEELGRQASNLERNAVLMLVGKELRMEGFRVHRTSVDMTWSGSFPLWIHKRI
eukprot:gnl/MRDRNA2_/MRDRNA2_55757_c0_seq2.p1 gnl/MRDRNA2_/MRDRNA2_55757_c0~~gnl/MRDRNA2_/MRDRNA2_55757_c0_seq2.p1  ORF type:complete len:247 (-),score=37.11 gnl/MRDRNA2_/MRDRNA2_55757_c0_seq2:262-900(-)